VCVHCQVYYYLIIIRISSIFSQLFLSSQQVTMDFKNKVVIITGASSGIGRGAAEYLSQLKGLIVLVGRNLEGLKETASKCQSETLIVQADVTKEADRKKIIDETIKKFGKINVLVNNAGQGVMTDTLSTKMEDYDYIMDLNVRSVFHLTQLAIPYLITTQGNIVNISSVAGLRAFPGATVYCMTKAALDQFTRCLALELALKNVRVNAVNPAAITTNFLQATGLSDAQANEYLEKAGPMHAMGRVGNVTETAHAIAYLASDMATFVTGTTLAVDGGRAIMCPR
jgi:NAD(P)-dependent dehydrogenase (short-subunit alcohol dehydrogenase family)